MATKKEKLDAFIEEITSGDALPVPDGEELGGDRVWSGKIAEIDEQTYCYYMEENAGPPKMMQDHWYVFSDAGIVTEPGILFWYKKNHYFARRLDDDQWERFLHVARVKKIFW